MIARLEVVMARFVFALFLIIIGGATVAKDGTIQPPRDPARMPSVNTERENYMDELFARYEAGEIDMNQAMEMYDKKFGAPDLMGIGKAPQMAPAAPPMGAKVR